MLWRGLVLAVTLSVLQYCVPPVHSADMMVRGYDRTLDFISSMVQQVLGGDSRRLETAMSQNKLQTTVPENVRFPCKTSGFRSKSPPTSVHKLRPGDIDVVASIGDSMLAGAGAISPDLPGVFIQNVGFSFGIGGNKDWRHFLTLPNMLREFNPNLVGQCVEDEVKQENSDCLNSATGGAVDESMLDFAKFIVKKIKADSRIDFEKHWKLVTMLVGANNVLRRVCLGGKETTNSAKHHRKSLQDALDYLQQHLPRTVVILIGVEDMAAVREFTKLPFRCFAHRYLLCPAAFYSVTKQDKELLPDLVRQYQEEENALVSSGRYDTKEDFTVVFQPFFTKIEIPSDENGDTNYSYLSADCIHLSQKGHGKATQALWNNLMEPVSKKTPGTISKGFICPSQQAPYIFTNLNSKLFLERGRQ